MRALTGSGCSQASQRALRSTRLTAMETQSELAARSSASAASSEGMRRNSLRRLSTKGTAGAARACGCVPVPVCHARPCSYDVTYTPRIEGPLLFDVSLARQPIRASPFQLTVRAAAGDEYFVETVFL